MEAPDLINNRYSMSRGPVKQQQQFGSEIQSNNSNNTNNINVKHFGAGGHSHAMPRPAYSPSPISGHKRDSSGFDVGRGSSPEVSEQKRKRIKADVEPARLTSPSAMLRTPPEHANVLIGDQVAARVTPENADKDDWIVVKVIRFDREANKYEVIDEEPGDDEESGQRGKMMIICSSLMMMKKMDLMDFRKEWFHSIMSCSFQKGIASENI